MTRSRRTGSQRQSRLDTLVATYAPIGERQLRRQKARRACITGSCAVIVGAGALLAVSDVSLLGAIGAAMRSAGPAISHVDADELVRERAEFAAKMAQLERQIADVHLQKQDLESQHGRLIEQSARLANLLDQAGVEQTDLEKRQQQGSQLDEEIAAIAAQRKALEDRWTQFEAQGELLAMEIIAVNAQRKELETQRRQIDRQQRELAEMLERADRLYRRDVSSAGGEAAQDASTTAVGEDDFIYTNNSLMVDNTELDGMRGGFSIGNGLDVSFGFTQTGSINGVEQFSNNFSVDSLATGFGNIDMSNMNSVVLQNGSGNYVSAGVLDALSDSFGSIIQNTLDDQVISTTTVFDISLHNMPGTLQGLAGEQALTDSLGSFR